MVQKKENDFLNKSNDKIDEMKAQLYSRKTGDITFDRKKLKKKEVNFENSWGKLHEANNLKDKDLYTFNRKGPTIFSIIFFLALIFFIIAVSFASFLFLFDKNEVRSDIQVSIMGPNSVRSGEILEFSVNLTNPSQLDYQDVEFSVSYPESSRNAETKEIVVYENVKYPENILSGGSIEQKFALILSGTKDERKKIEVDVSYKVGDFSNLIFAKREYEVVIESPPVTMEMNYPAKVASKKDFLFTVDVISNSVETMNDLIIIGEYPSGFIASETVPETVFSNDSQGVFIIDKLEPGEKKSITITGTLAGVDDEVKFFNFSLGDSVPFRNEMRTLFFEVEKRIDIKRPDIDFSITTIHDNKAGEVVAHAGETISFDVVLGNSFSDIMTDIRMLAYFPDEVIDSKSVEAPRGFYDSNNNIILWNKRTDKYLGSLRRQGVVQENFMWSIKPLRDIAGYFEDPQVIVDFEVEALAVSDDSSQGSIQEEFRKVVKVATKVDLSTHVFHQEGPFENVGSSQPKVGEPTTYTIAWDIYNSSSDIFDVEVSAVLPLYVRYLGNVSPEQSYISYDEENRKITLQFNKIDAFIGYRTDPKRVYFQVEIIPSISQVGTQPILVQEKVLKGRDNFIGRDVQLIVPADTTELKGREAYIKSGTVVE